MSVEEILAALARAWNDGDAEAYAALFTPDAGFVDVLGRITAFHNVVQSDLQAFAGQDGRPAASDSGDGRHRDPRI